MARGISGVDDLDAWCIDRHRAGDGINLFAGFHRLGRHDQKLMREGGARDVQLGAANDHPVRPLLDHAQIMVATRDYTRAAELLREALAIKDEPRVARFLARVEESIQPD